MHKCNSTLNTLSSVANQTASLPLAMRFCGKDSLRHLGLFLWNKLDKKFTETSSQSRFKFHIRCKDLTELINGTEQLLRVLYPYLLTCARVRRIALIIVVYFSIARGRLLITKEA